MTKDQIEAERVKFEKVISSQPIQNDFDIWLAAKQDSQPIIPEWIITELKSYLCPIMCDYHGNPDPYLSGGCCRPRLQKAVSYLEGLSNPTPSSSDHIEQPLTMVEQELESYIEGIESKSIAAAEEKFGVKFEEKNYTASNDGYITGENYNAGLWSRKNIEAFVADGNRVGSTIIIKNKPMFQAAASGLWYENPMACGEVSAVTFDAKLYTLPRVERPDSSEPNEHEWILEKISYHKHERDDLNIDGCLNYLANEWKEIRGRTTRQLVMQILALLAGQSPIKPQRITEQDAREIFVQMGFPDAMFSEWMNRRGGKILLAKLNEHREPDYKAQTEKTWLDACEWIRNNYQSYPNIATLIDSMKEYFYVNK